MKCCSFAVALPGSRTEPWAEALEDHNMAALQLRPRPAQESGEADRTRA